MKPTTTFTFFSLLALFTLVAGVGHAAYAPYTEDSANTSTLTMNYDNLRVIPEPSSFGLLLLGGVTLLGRRRGRRK
ncbi:MAG: PEP-CTERM sorting domain-containing protein [bacterium]